MHRLEQIIAISRQLRQADAAADWRALAAIDREIAVIGAKWTSHGAWNGHERQALRGLRQAHADACGHCAAEAKRLQAQLDSMVATKEGWLAYAAHGEWQGMLE